MKYSCYQDGSVIHGWFVYCAFCWQMQRLSKLLEIRFRMASFSKMSLLTCPCLRRKRFEKSQAILEHLMASRSSISTSKPEQLLSLMCFFFSVSWSRAYGLCGLSLYTSNDLTYNSIRFKKPLDIFWPQIQRKGSEEYLVMILAVNRKFCLPDSWFSGTLYSQYLSSLQLGSRPFFTPLKSAHRAEQGSRFGRFLVILKVPKWKKCIYPRIQKSAYTGHFVKKRPWSFVFLHNNLHWSGK